VDHRDARLDQVEAVEESAELRAGAQRQGDARRLEILDRRRLLRGEVGGGVGGHQTAAGRQFGQQPADQGVRAVRVGDEVEQRHERERCRSTGEQLAAHLLVDGVVVLAAEVPVVHPRGMRSARVDSGRGCPVMAVSVSPRRGK
jgi:hypothetical protein